MSRSLPWKVRASPKPSGGVVGLHPRRSSQTQVPNQRLLTAQQRHNATVLPGSCSDRRRSFNEARFTLVGLAVATLSADQCTLSIADPCVRKQVACATAATVVVEFRLEYSMTGPTTAEMLPQHDLPWANTTLNRSSICPVTSAAGTGPTGLRNPPHQLRSLPVQRLPVKPAGHRLRSIPSFARNSAGIAGRPGLRVSPSDDTRSNSPSATGRDSLIR